MNFTHGIELNLDPESKAILKQYVELQKAKHEAAEKAKNEEFTFEDDESALVFRVQTQSGTKINIPAGAIKTGAAVITAFAAVNVIINLIKVFKD